MSTEREPLENQIFSWEEWNEEGPMAMQYGDVELKVQVGEFPAGTKFPAAFLLGEQSLLVLIDDKQEEHGFALKLSVGEAVQPDVHEHDHCGCGHEH